MTLRQTPGGPPPRTPDRLAALNALADLLDAFDPKVATTEELVMVAAVLIPLRERSHLFWAARDSRHGMRVVRGGDDE